jgi:hypothetical protein
MFIFLNEYIINVQRDATTSSLYFILLQYPCTRFGCLLHPSSGVGIRNMSRDTAVTMHGTMNIKFLNEVFGVSIGD